MRAERIERRISTVAAPLFLVALALLTVRFRAQAVEEYCMSLYAGESSLFCKDIQTLTAFNGWGLWIASLVMATAVVSIATLAILAVLFGLLGRQWRLRGPEECSYYRDIFDGWLRLSGLLAAISLVIIGASQLLSGNFV